MLAASELILTPEGQVYHLRLRPEQVADTIIAVGDPERVAQVSRYLDLVEFRQQHREMVTHTGTLGGRRLTIISTGMGTDNVEIVLTELDALVNIDLATRTPRPQARAVRIVRVGTSGALRPEIAVGSHLASASALGLDTLLQFYQHTPARPRLTADLQQHLGLKFEPYWAAADQNLLNTVGAGLLPGHTVTCPGFYAPQGRQLRARLSLPHLLDDLASFAGPQGLQFTNFEMETAAYYALGGLLGHQVLSLNAIIANRPRGEFDPQPEKTVDALIRHTLERLTATP
ncbi:MAG: nucleoside phosphorylase [Bernardetiaceae bacterium]|jgi:uridine phosphorylase|nr:nucleoside phosphorylase [Bernardetiaceae bacterium]